MFAIVLCRATYAQVVEIPDPNLRQAIGEALNLPNGDPVTQSAMRRLNRFVARDRGITDLSGLEFATNLTFLNLLSNRIEDISPLGNLTQLTELHLGGNRIEDIGPLVNLTQLKALAPERKLAD